MKLAVHGSDSEKALLKAIPILLDWPYNISNL